ncbi:MAG: hypothetical protein OXF77_02620 [Thaumarchaeota archaeon]|nr:hypothetical protein [Nitrososphaerota archaeon]
MDASEWSGEEKVAVGKVIGQVATDIGTMLKSSEVEAMQGGYVDEGDVAGSALQGAGAGIATWAALAPVTAAAGPVGVAIGFTVAVVGIFTTASKKREARRKNRHLFKQEIKKYKKSIGKRQKDVEVVAFKVEETARSGALQSIFDATENATNQIYAQLGGKSATGAINITQKKRIETLEDNAGEILESTYDKLIKKSQLLAQGYRHLQAAKDKHINTPLDPQQEDFSRIYDDPNIDKAEEAFRAYDAV